MQALSIKCYYIWDFENGFFTMTKIFCWGWNLVSPLRRKARYFYIGYHLIFIIRGISFSQDFDQAHVEKCVILSFPRLEMLLFLLHLLNKRIDILVKMFLVDGKKEVYQYKHWHLCCCTINLIELIRFQTFMLMVNFCESSMGYNPT